MKTITNETKDVVVFYYENLDDLRKNEEKFNSLKIEINHHSENTPCRICPRLLVSGETVNIILLHNTGNKENDLKKLNECLKIVRLPEFKEL